MTLEHWIRVNTRQMAPRSTALLKLIFSDPDLAGDEPVWLHELIRLMAPFGLDERATRTSVFRLTEQGCLQSRRHGRRASYEVAPSAVDGLRAAWRRLNAAPERHWDGDWTLLINAGGRIGAATYATLRKALANHGYCALAPNVLARPTDHETRGQDDLAELGEDAHMEIFKVSGRQVTGGRPPAEFGREAWDLSAARTDYERFLQQCAPLREALRSGHTPSPEQAFVIRVLVGLAWHQCRHNDPMLPLEFLPEDWPARSAYDLYRDLRRHTQVGAQRHVHSAPVVIPAMLARPMPELCAQAA
ncbi:transcriptional regulator, PaaX family protein [Duganella sp. LX20W]|uniref:Transcriptional regulator, PaaX family protein n=1 Tax=Rugamonas brunnea TaxID=2758569 RepID=A0A7W2ETN5_9BURK|nr:PaaX family transcriptional regulator C-terminal domain-containing protein [Rugamonas brunnea]MBA5638436.1 transcriptional regulator, PaaX family protein [Rugamonas brunnea]